MVCVHSPLYAISERSLWRHLCPYASRPSTEDRHVCSVLKIFWARTSRRGTARALLAQLACATGQQAGCPQQGRRVPVAVLQAAGCAGSGGLPVGRPPAALPRGVLLSQHGSGQPERAELPARQHGMSRKGLRSGWSLVDAISAATGATIGGARASRPPRLPRLLLTPARLADNLYASAVRLGFRPPFFKCAGCTESRGDLAAPPHCAAPCRHGWGDLSVVDFDQDAKHFQSWPPEHFDLQVGPLPHTACRPGLQGRGSAVLCSHSWLAGSSPADSTPRHDCWREPWRPPVWDGQATVDGCAGGLGEAAHGHAGQGRHAVGAPAGHI